MYEIPPFEKGKSFKRQVTADVMNELRRMWAALRNITGDKYIKVTRLPSGMTIAFDGKRTLGAQPRIHDHTFARRLPAEMPEVGDKFLLSADGLADTDDDCTWLSMNDEALVEVNGAKYIFHVDADIPDGTVLSFRSLGRVKNPDDPCPVPVDEATVGMFEFGDLYAHTFQITVDALDGGWFTLNGASGSDLLIVDGTDPTYDDGVNPPVVLSGTFTNTGTFNGAPYFVYPGSGTYLILVYGDDVVAGSGERWQVMEGSTDDPNDLSWSMGEVMGEVMWRGSTDKETPTGTYDPFGGGATNDLVLAGTLYGPKVSVRAYYEEQS